MSFFPDMGRSSLVAAGDHVRAIGWLHPDHAYTTGEVSAQSSVSLSAAAAAERRRSAIGRSLRIC
jgi:hypothetical protein